MYWQRVQPIEELPFSCVCVITGHRVVGWTILKMIGFNFSLSRLFQDQRQQKRQQRGGIISFDQRSTWTDSTINSLKDLNDRKVFQFTSGWLMLR